MGMEAFYTRDKAREGKRLTLHTPDGKPTEHWLQVRHVWSDEFQQAEQEAIAGLRNARLDGEPGQIAQLQRDGKVRVLASLVAAWSFDHECTPEAVAEFLSNAPQIADQIDRFAGDSRAFFASESSNSGPGSTPSES